MLLSGVARVQDLYLDWARTTGERLERVEVTAPATARSRQGSSSAAFFSGGVDSFYTLLRNVQRYPASDARSIQHLVLVHGFDVGLDDSGLFAQVEREARRAADRFGRNLLTVATNARAVTGGVDWGRYGHGAALAAVGLALAPMVHTVFIPSTAAFSELKPWGSHPALDPLWSTEQLEFVHDGAEAMRHEKIRFVASSASALESLRVCWENRDGAYNCGRCEKCLRTMLELRLCGALDRADRFPRKIAAIDVQDVIIPENCRKYWHRILDHRAELGSPELVNAIEAALARRSWRPKSWW
jgi:hypothetical protein